MLEMGIVVGLGLLVTFCKVSWRWRLRMLSYPVAMDIGVFALLCLLHWGTFSGIMVATVGALFCSMSLSLGRWAFGYVEKGQYIPGRFPIRSIE